MQQDSARGFYCSGGSSIRSNSKRCYSLDRSSSKKGKGPNLTGLWHWRDPWPSLAWKLELAPQRRRSGIGAHSERYKGQGVAHWKTDDLSTVGALHRFGFQLAEMRLEAEPNWACVVRQTRVAFTVLGIVVQTLI